MAAKKKSTGRKRVQNYLNNARLMENIIESKKIWEDAKDVATKRWVKDNGVKGIKTFADYAKATNTKDGNVSSLNMSELPKMEDEKYFPSAAQCMTPELVKMIMMLVEKYATRANWRGYCVDHETECLTKRGWCGIDELNDSDTILSFDNGRLVWSDVRSIYRGEFDGPMFHLTVQGMDSLVTQGHKLMTDDGLRRVEYLRERDRLVMIGSGVESEGETYSDSFVELVGWVITEGNYYVSEDRNYTRVTVFQNEGKFAECIRECLQRLEQNVSEYHRQRVVGENTPVHVAFHLTKELCQQITEVAPNKVPTNEFLHSLSAKQRLLLIDTMVDGDGWRTNGYTNYTQVCKEHIDFFIALCTISGKRTSVRVMDPVGYGDKPIHVVRVFSNGKNSVVENIDFHGGKSGRSGKSKVMNPNFPTKYYRGRVWCPQTEYGCFMARRKGTVFLTGNTYIDDMRSEALVSLLNGTLKFDPEKSQNPFGYMTQIVTNSFLSTLDKEKKVRRIRDDILEQNGFTPSHTRQLENESVAIERHRKIADRREGLIDDDDDYDEDDDS